MADRTNSRPVPLRPRAPVSHANRVAAARVYIAASIKSGQPVPDWIRELTAENDR